MKQDYARFNPAIKESEIAQFTRKREAGVASKPADNVAIIVDANVNGAAPADKPIDVNAQPQDDNLAAPADGANASGAKSGDVSQNIPPQMD